MNATATSIGTGGEGALTRRALAALFVAQALSAGAVTVSTSLSSIIATRLSGSESLSGLPATINMIASALAAALAGRLMAVRGRRFGLLTGYALGTLGCLVAATCAIVGSFPGFLAGSALVGISRGGIDQGRYAVAELVPIAARGRTIGIFLSGSVIGAVLAAAVTPLVRAGAQHFVIPEIEAGWYLAGLFLLLGGLLATLYPTRPPQQAAGDEAEPVPQRSAVPQTRYPAMAAMAAAHGTMVMLMVLMPLHAKHLGHGLPTISTLLTAHFLGMYGLAWLTGSVADRVGHWRVIAAGGIVLALSAVVALNASSASAIGLALFLLGLGWNFCYLSASALLAAGAGLSERARVQGAADLLNWTAAALGALGGGVLAGQQGFSTVAVAGLIVSAIPLLAAARLASYSRPAATA